MAGRTATSVKRLRLDEGALRVVWVTGEARMFPAAGSSEGVEELGDRSTRAVKQRSTPPPEEVFGKLRGPR